jgi:hypothetical protein
MPINFIPNDPLAVGELPLIQKDPRPNRPAGRAGFTVSGTVAEGLYNQDTKEFAYWQSREAALAAVEAWEALDGNLTTWARTGKKLELSPDFDNPDFPGHQRLNAFYDGEGLRFFTDDGDPLDPPVFSGASTDTVAHETGHALLDTLRPELFGSMLPEVAAFHESFGDCMALLTALADQPTRFRLLQVSPDLGTANFVEAGSEYLSDAIRRVFGNVSPSKPRRALNTYKWQLPSTLPAGKFEDPPELLSREAHSFSRVFTGCFYDIIRNIFGGLSQQTEATLADVARVAGRLLIAGVRASPQVGRYFRAVGRGMVLADGASNGGANREAIGQAFAAHGVALGSAAMLAPTAALDGPAPTLLKAKAKLAASTAKDVRDRIRAVARSKLAVGLKQMFGEKVAEVVHQREIDLGQVDKRLKGVVALAAETVLVGSSGGRAALLGAIPEPNQTEDEVTAFVETLLRFGRIKLDRGHGAVAAPAAPQPPTHVIRVRGKKKVLERIRFLCGCAALRTP